MATYTYTVKPPTSEPGRQITVMQDRRYKLSESLYFRAKDYMRQHKSELVSYTVDAADFYQAGGSSLYTLVLGEFYDVVDSSLSLSFRALVVGIERSLINPMDCRVELNTRWKDLIEDQAEQAEDNETSPAPDQVPSDDVILDPPDDWPDDAPPNIGDDWAYGDDREATATDEIDETATSIPVDNTMGWPDSGSLMADDERMNYGSKTNNSFDELERGREGTKPSKHGKDARVTDAAKLDKQNKVRKFDGSALKEGSVATTVRAVILARTTPEVRVWTNYQHFELNDYCYEVSAKKYYKATAASTNVVPPNAAYWTEILTWSSTTAYALNDWVICNGYPYQSKVASNQGQNPEASFDSWMKKQRVFDYWLQNTEYVEDERVVYAGDGQSYRAKRKNEAKNPSTEASDWELISYWDAGRTYSAGEHVFFTYEDPEKKNMNTYFCFRCMKSGNMGHTPYDGTANSAPWWAFATPGPQRYIVQYTTQTGQNKILYDVGVTNEWDIMYPLNIMVSVWLPADIDRKSGKRSIIMGTAITAAQSTTSSGGGGGSGTLYSITMDDDEQ